MSHSSKKKRKLPKDITERSDAEALTLIMGKPIKRELDKVAHSSKKKGDSDVMER